MEETVLIGRGRHIETIPQATWKQHVIQIPQHGLQRLSFMTELHRQVRNFVVSNLVKQQRPIEPEEIASSLHISFDQVQAILETLERKLFFLVRNERGAVAWAYPVTVEPTPHRLKFRSGETLYAA